MSLSAADRRSLLQSHSWTARAQVIRPLHTLLAASADGLSDVRTALRLHEVALAVEAASRGAAPACFLELNEASSHLP